MGAELGLHDVAAGHPRAEEELSKLRALADATMRYVTGKPADHPSGSNLQAIEEVLRWLGML